MKNRTFIFFNVIFAFLFSASSWGAKVGTVDLNRVVVGIKEMKGVREKLKAFHMSKQMELKKEEEKISELHKSFQKKSMVMNEKTKMEKQKEIQEIGDIEQRDREACDEEYDTQQKKRLKHDDQWQPQYVRRQFPASSCQDDQNCEAHELSDHAHRDRSDRYQFDRQHDVSHQMYVLFDTDSAC